MRIRYGKKENGDLVKKAVVYTRDEHKINAADVDRDAVFIVSRLRAADFESYIVGGAVRDLMLGKKPKDFDIVTEATPAKLKKLFRNSRIIGRRFRLVHVFFGSRIFEVSTFRSLRDGHTSNTYGTIEEDVLRRDFSANALFYDPENQVVVDYVGGVADIRRRRLRPVIPAGLIFRDDPVRMIRAVKYAAAAGFSIPWLLGRRIKKEAPLLESVSPSRRTEEMLKIIRSPRAAEIAGRLEEAGLWTYLQTEASARMKTGGEFRRRYLESLAALGKRNGEAVVIEPGESLAALIRDYLADFCKWEELKKPAGAAKSASAEYAAALAVAYKAAFYAARRFILPINPPRIEMEKAVRLVFTERGLEVRKIRLFDDRRSRVRSRARTPQTPEAQRHAARPRAERPSPSSPCPGADEEALPAASGTKRRRRERKP